MDNTFQEVKFIERLLKFKDLFLYSKENPSNVQFLPLKPYKLFKFKKLQKFR